jgi:DNA repair protein RadC
MDTLRKKMDQNGEASLSESELLSLVTGKPTAIFTSILDRTDGLAGLARSSIEDLENLPGVGGALCARIQAALELGRRLAVPRPSKTRPIERSADVADFYRNRLQHHERESMHLLLLDSKNRPTKNMCISQGSWTSCPVDPKVVFKTCLRHNASALILIHNHPSGDPSPSKEDLHLTHRIIKAGELMGVRVLDHLIVGHEGYTSLADAGYLESSPKTHQKS